MRSLGPALLCAALALAACGRAERPAQVHGPCPRAVASALGPGTRATLRARAPDVVTCVYRAARTSGARVQVTLDTAPQAGTRFARTVVERGQAYLGAPRPQLPQLLPGIGLGAAWIAAERVLLATADGRLVTVTVEQAAPGTSPRITASAAARAALRS